MHVKPVPQPLLRLAADLALETITVALGNEVLGEVVTQILKDDSTLGDGERLVKGRGRDGDSGRLAQRVHGFELRRSELVGLALVDCDVVVYALGAFFKQPDDTLGARLFKPTVDEMLDYWCSDKWGSGVFLETGRLAPYF